MSKSNPKSKVYEGNGVPVIVYPDNSQFKLPEPLGENKEDLRSYDFIAEVIDSYRSEANTKIEVGKKFLFDASLAWFCVSKINLKALQKAHTSEYIFFVLNDDKPDIKYKCRVSSLKYRHPKGIYGLGYSIWLTLIGIEYLDAPGYGNLELTGFGLDYGNAPDNQSP